MGDNLAIGFLTYGVAFPAYQALTKTLIWTGFFFTPVFNFLSPQFGGISRIDAMLLVNANNPIWQWLGDETKIQARPLVEGKNMLSFPRLITARITITMVGDQVSRWWIPSDHGNYGCLQPISSYGPGPLEFINSKTTVFNFPPGSASGIIITLAPGCSGSVDLVPWLGIPPLQATSQPPQWATLNGPWPYYGPKPTLPQ